MIGYENNLRLLLAAYDADIQDMVDVDVSQEPTEENARKIFDELQR